MSILLVVRRLRRRLAARALPPPGGVRGRCKTPKMCRDDLDDDGMGTLRISAQIVAKRKESRFLRVISTCTITMYNYINVENARTLGIVQF